MCAPPLNRSFAFAFVYRFIIENFHQLFVTFMGSRRNGRLIRQYAYFFNFEVSSEYQVWLRCVFRVFLELCLTEKQNMIAENSIGRENSCSNSIKVIQLSRAFKLTFILAFQWRKSEVLWSGNLCSVTRYWWFCEYVNISAWEKLFGRHFEIFSWKRSCMIDI